jgi:hypothetical protein
MHKATTTDYCLLNMHSLLTTQYRYVMTHLLTKLRSIRLWRSVLPLNTVPSLPQGTDSHTKSTTLTDNLFEDMHAL